MPDDDEDYDSNTIGGDKNNKDSKDNQKDDHKDNN